jgi:very-short-patch-repair endonuclease
VIEDASREPSLVARTHAALLVAASGSVVCGPTALALLNVALPRTWIQRIEECIDIQSVQGSLPRPQRRGVRLYRSSARPQPWRMVEGAPVAHPAECWLQMAQWASWQELVCVGDGLVRRRQPLTTLAEFDAHLAAAHGRRGCTNARVARKLIRPDTDSYPESWVRLAIIQDGLPCPAVNYALRTRAGTIIHLDLAYPEWRIAIEYDGVHHRTNEDQYEYDKERYAELQALGWKIIRATRSDLANPARFLANLRRALPADARWVSVCLPAMA